MKTKFFLPVVVLALAGCNKAGKLNEPSKFVPPAGPMQLQLKWTPKEKVKMGFELKQQSEMNLPNQPGPTKQDTALGERFSLDVLNQDAAGGHQIELQFLDAHMNVQTGGRTTLNYDSAKHEENKRNPIAKVFDKIVGSKIEYFLDASNNVEHMEGVKELNDRIASGNANAAAQLQSIYDETFFRRLMSGNRFLPPNPVKPGDSWPVELEIPNRTLGDMKLNYNVTFIGWEMHGKRQCARLESQGTIKTAPNTKPNAAGITISILAADDSVVSWFDPELGITDESDIIENMTLAITVPTGGRASAGGQMMNITNNLQQTIAVKLDSVN